ncbi:E1-E2 ATPase-domain-containing protein [Triangularia verruculosa]|uniref:E1-E2 ATPase-domain-containing protein n=1 Tax=Triangularia verruculosa TaxID=2587418 RepID=A0AAN6XBQ3_9PEZI|nr:E1-E2 ATPase-domain-containing protein [Triangularia verruculosa]
MAPASGTRAPAAPTETATTSFLLTNMHCPTCVSTIKSVLLEYGDGHLVRWVSPNIVTSVVTVEHSPAASLQHMHKLLEENGFEVCGVTTSSGNISDLDMGMEMEDLHRNGEGSSSHSQPSGSALARWMNPFRSLTSQPEKVKAHLQNCAHCRASKERGLDEMHHVETALPVRTSTNNTSFSELHEKSPQTFIAIESADALPSQPIWRATLAVGGMTCGACVNMISEGLKQYGWISKTNVNLLTNSATIDLTEPNRTDDLVRAIEELGYEATLSEVVAIQPNKRRTNSDTWQATVAIGGMTCASCTNGITEGLKKLDWIDDVVVNLLSNSATVKFHGQHNAPRIVEAIEELGFDAVADSLVSLDEKLAGQNERAVEIRIDGLHCNLCPARVVNCLAGFRRQLEINSPPTRSRPIIKVTYVPDAPSFTVRQILAAIEASDPGFRASIYHPPSLEERSKLIQQRHQRALAYRVLGTFLVAIPTFVIGIVYMMFIPHEKAHHLMSPWTSGISRAQIALFILATPVYFFAADVFHKSAFKEIKTLWRPGSRVPILKRFYKFGSMNTLMSLGTTIAYVASVCQMIAAWATGAAETHDGNFYYDTVVFLTLFLLMGRYIESYSKKRTGDAVELLAKLRPTTAILVDGYGTTKEGDEVVKADLLDFGDIVRVPHGASPPSDGVVISGDSSFDESSLTGESRLVKKVSGDQVFSGTVNKGSSLLVRITGVAGHSLLDQIVSVVREGQTKQAKIERVADYLTSYFVPSITAFAILTWIVWMSLGYGGRLPEHFLSDTTGGWIAFSLQFAIAVFVVACPCGLGLAAPTAIFVGSGLAANHGILAKGGGEAFEKASRIDCVVFDKTGTLTTGGEPRITDSEIYAERTPEKKTLLAALKAVEENSSHPIARAIISFCNAEEDLPKVTADSLHELPGKGMKAVCQPTAPETLFELIVGNEALMKDFGVAISSEVERSLEKWKQEAKSIALIATKALQDPASTTWALAAALSISDPIRPEAKVVIAALQESGTRVWMLSGDNPTTATAVAQQLGIPAGQVIAGVLPAGKADQIKYLQQTVKARKGKNTESDTERAMIAMVGDGINDSPALATADVGIAIGSGSDVAISSADFVLVKSDLKKVVTLLDLSRTVFRRIKINFGWAIVYNTVMIPVAAGVFYPIVSNGKHVSLDPAWAALAMALSSISVVVSSLALRWPWVGFRERKLTVNNH